MTGRWGPLVGLTVLLMSCSGTLDPVSSSPSAPATGAAGFDPVRASQVLSPAVALVIVNTGSGSTAEGSGFVIQAHAGNSYVVTNNHVVAGARRVQILMPDGRHFVVDVQGSDPIEDIAVLKAADTLPTAQFADSTQVKLGQPVLAIGSPLGGQNVGSVTVGVISALHRTLSCVGNVDGASEELPDVLQTDAPISAGNSGGPLADGEGRVVGMNTAGDTRGSRLGFAIPSRVVGRIAGNLIAGRMPGHAYVGVNYQQVEEALPAREVSGYGVVVVSTVPDGPASRAGLKGGDVIEKVDGVALNNGQTLGGVIQPHNPGDTVKLTALRGGQTMVMDLTLGDRPSGPGTPSCG